MSKTEKYIEICHNCKWSRRDERGQLGCTAFSNGKYISSIVGESHQRRGCFEK